MLTVDLFFGRTRAFGRSVSRCALVGALALGLRGASAAEPANPALRSVGAIRAVGEWDLRQTHPLHLEGTVTLVDHDRQLVVLQDETGAIALRLDGAGAAISAGRKFAIEAADSWPYSEALQDYPLHASGREQLSSFEAPSGTGNNYVARVRGHLHPPATGEYRFWIASDDTSELWLGVDDDRRSARLIAAATIWTKPREWNRVPTQKSAAIFLEAGRRYYIEAVHEQGPGTDHLSVSWEGPKFPQQIIAGAHLSPWVEPAPGEKNAAEPARGGILREYWLGRAVVNAGAMTARRKLDSTLVLAGASLRELGPGPALPARAAQPGQGFGAAEDFSWRELEGTVAFVARHGDALVLELADGAPRTRVVVQHWLGGTTQRLNGQRVRFQGVAESVLGENGDRVLGRLWVPSLEKLTIISQWPHAEGYQAATIAQLLAGDPPTLRDRPVKLRGRVVEAGNDGRFTVSDDGAFYGYTSTDGIVWQQIGAPIELAMSQAVEVGLVVSSRSTEASATAVFDRITGLAEEPIRTAVGGPLRFGDYQRRNGRVTLTGSGHDMWISPDQFYFAHRPLVGAGEIVARIAEFAPAEEWAKAGLMIRESLAPDAQFVDLVQTGAHGCCLQWRKSAEGSAPLSTSDDTVRAPRWLKLVRRFNTVRVTAAQTDWVEVGARVEVVGYVVEEGGRLAISDASAREVSPETDQPGVAGSARPLVELARIRSATGNAALYDVLRVRGVVTFAGEAAGRRYVAIQDHSGAAFLAAEQLPPVPRIRAGQFIEVNSSPGRQTPTPNLIAESTAVLGPALFPAPLRHPSEYVLPRRGEAAWIEVEGVVRSVAANGIMRLKDGRDFFAVAVAGASVENLRRYVDGTLRLRGVLAYPTDQERLLLVPSVEQIEVIDAPPPEPFALPVQRIGELMPNLARNRAAHRIRVKGTVTFADRGFVYVQDDSGGARVELDDAAAPPKIGESVEAAGFPEMAEDHSAILAPAIMRPVAAVAPPSPVTVTTEDILSGRFGARLVRLRAIFSRDRAADGGNTLELQLDQRIFRASLPMETRPSIPAGSLVEVTGVCVLETALPEWIKVSAGSASILPVRLLLRGPADVVVLQKPRWWAVKRTLLVAGAAALVLLVSFYWIHTLRRRVASRTAELRTAMEKLQRETQTAATLAERDRLAGEIHDSLEQGFSGLILQLDTTAKLGACPPEVRTGLGLARNMVAFSRNEVRHAVWDLQSPVLENSDLGTALKKIVEQLAPETPHSTISVEGEARPLGSAVEHHLLRIAQEAIANGVKHAAAQNLDLVLSYSATEVSLSIRDDGCGFVPGDVLTGGLGHFGLRSLRGRASKIQGTLAITSEPGRGTTVAVRVAVPPVSALG